MGLKKKEKNIDEKILQNSTGQFNVAHIRLFYQALIIKIRWETITNQENMR